ncbi:hypothetical protein Dimus_003747, partial [Dionaea muscipula]
MDKLLHVKIAAFGRESSGLHPRLVERNRVLPCAKGGSNGVPEIHRSFSLGGGLFSYKSALLGVQKDSTGSGITKSDESPSLVMVGKSHGVEQLKRCYVVEWETGSCAGIQVSSLASDLGVEVSLVKVGRHRGLLPFEDDEGFGRALSLERVWWSSRGLSMTPLSEEIDLVPRREAWLRCFGVPIYARCSSTFMAIGQRWGDVVTIVFGSLESGELEDGRVNIVTDVGSPINCSFTLVVDGLEFKCWVVEESPIFRHPLMDLLGPLRSSGSDSGISDSQLDEGAAMVEAERLHTSPDVSELSLSVDGVLTKDLPSMQELASEDGNRDVMDSALCPDGSGLEVALIRTPFWSLAAGIEDGNNGEGFLECGLGPAKGRMDKMVLGLAGCGDGSADCGLLLGTMDKEGRQGSVDFVEEMAEGGLLHKKDGGPLLGCGPPGENEQDVGDRSDDIGFCVVFDGKALDVPPIDLHVQLGGSPPPRQCKPRGFLPPHPTKQKGSKVVVKATTLALSPSASNVMDQLVKKEAMECVKL